MWSPLHSPPAAHAAEREYLTGVIRVLVKEARDLKVKPSEWSYLPCLYEVHVCICECGWCSSQCTIRVLYVCTVCAYVRECGLCVCFHPSHTYVLVIQVESRLHLDSTWIAHTYVYMTYSNCNHSIQSQVIIWGV